MTKWQIVHIDRKDRSLMWYYNTITNDIAEVTLWEMQCRNDPDVRKRVGDFYDKFDVGYCLKTTIEEE